MPGQLSIDEGINVIQSACTGNANTIGFILTPQYHASTAKHIVVKNRRLLEDKLHNVLDNWEVSLNFSDANHGGDKRKKSQQCFSKEIVHIFPTFSHIFPKTLKSLKHFSPSPTPTSPHASIWFRLRF